MNTQQLNYYEPGSFENQVLSTVLAVHMETMLLARYLPSFFMSDEFFWQFFSLKMSFVLDKKMHIIFPRNKICILPY